MRLLSSPSSKSMLDIDNHDPIFYCHCDIDYVIDLLDQKQKRPLKQKNEDKKNAIVLAFDSNICLRLASELHVFYEIREYSNGCSNCSLSPICGCILFCKCALCLFGRSNQ